MTEEPKVVYKTVEAPKVVYKTNPWWKRVTGGMVILFLGGNTFMYNFIEDHVRVVSGRLTVDYQLSSTEHTFFCGGVKLLGIDIDGC